MTQTRADQLIESLADQLEPVKALRHPLLRIAPWALLSVVYIGLIVYMAGLRPDIHQKLAEASFIFEVMILGFTAISAALASAWLCVPDMRGAKWLVALPLTSLGIFTAWVGSRLIAGEGAHIPHLHWDACITEGLLMIGLPVWAIIFLARRGNTTKPRIMAAMNVLAVGAAGYLGLLFTCYMDTIGHLGIYHVLPYMAVALLAGAFSRRLYRW